MSYILDALKKVEHEKLKKSSPGGMTSIAGDLFHERVQPPAAARRWTIVVLLMVASCLIFAGTWYLLKGKQPKNAPVPQTVVPPVSAPAASPPGVPIAAPAPLPAVELPASNGAKSVPGNSLPVPAALVAPASEESDGEGRSARRLIRTPPQTVTAPSPPSTPGPAPKTFGTSLQVIPPQADIKLSGIAWQDERSARRAVVNGFLLKEGALVSGAKITEIMADKVRFTSSGGTFELRLDAASSGEGKR